MNYEAVYVHIPFCKQKCLYCDFTSYAGCSCDTMDAYVQALCKEIRLKSFEVSKFSQNGTIFFGGGTPSILPVNSIKVIVDELIANGFWHNPREATIEVNPGTADFDKLKALRELGFDRISFGVQSLDDSELKTIGRIHTSKEALEVIRMAQEVGFKRINADIMYGLPTQSLESLRKTLETINSVGIEHISAYSLILEEGTPLERLVDLGKMSLPTDDETADMYDFVQEFLASHGYKRYEVSNYAKNNGESEHNKVYWVYHPYLAFGAAACSFNGQERITAIGDVDQYVEALNSIWDKAYNNDVTEIQQDIQEVSSIYNNEDLYEVEKLSQDDLIAEFMFMGLRTCRGANLTEAKERFGIDVLQEFAGELQQFFANDLLEFDKESNYLKLTESGMAVGNNVFEAFLR